MVLWSYNDSIYSLWKILPVPKLKPHHTKRKPISAKGIQFQILSLPSTPGWEERRSTQSASCFEGIPQRGPEATGKREYQKYTLTNLWLLLLIP